MMVRFWNLDASTFLLATTAVQLSWHTAVRDKYPSAGRSPHWVSRPCTVDCLLHTVSSFDTRQRARERGRDMGRELHVDCAWTR